MKNTRHLTATLGAIALFILGTASLRADTIVIDDFNEDLGITNSDAFVTGSMLGGEADYYPIGTISTSITDGVLKFSGTGPIVIQYDGVDSSTDQEFGLPVTDLTSVGSNPRFEIEVASHSGDPFDMEVALFTGTPVETSGLAILDASGSGVLTFPLADFEMTGSGPADLTSVNQIELIFALDATVEIASIRLVGDTAAVVDTTKPKVKFLKKKKLKKPRRRHAIKGIARDNDAVKKVQARVPGKKGWRKTKLRNGKRFKYRTPRLKKKNTRIKFRAWDASGNRSRVKKVRVKGPAPKPASSGLGGSGGGRG